MSSTFKTSASKQSQRHSDATLLSGFMDRKTHHFTWPYSYPPFPSAPGWFSVNGVGYQPQFPGGGVGNTGMGVPIWFQSPDLRSMPAMTIPRQQPASQAQEASNNSSNVNNNGAAATTPPRSWPPAADTANDNTAGPVRNDPARSALIPSRRTGPMTVDAAVQCLSGQLHDAIRVCTDCLKTHSEFVAKAHFTTVETRNGLWKDLLEHRFKNSGFVQDGFNNLGQRLGYYMEQAHCAAQNDPALKSEEQERRRSSEHRARRLRLLRAACDEVVKLSDGASVDVLDCIEMLGLMRDMKKKLSGDAGGSHGETKSEQGEEKEGGKEDGEEGGNPGGAQSSEAWPQGS